jgi:hypothetical protein
MIARIAGSAAGSYRSRAGAPLATLLVLAALCALACGSASSDRPVVAFRPPAPSLVPGCDLARARIGRAHVELFAFGRIVVVPAGIGIAGGRRQGAYVLGGHCRARLWTHEPTGLVELSRSDMHIADLFAVWGQPLGEHRMLGFRGEVRVWLDGTAWHASPGLAPLKPGAQVVIQAGLPLAPVHGAYAFPPPSAHQPSA